MKKYLKNVWPLLCGVGLLATNGCSDGYDDSTLIIDPVIWDYSPVILSLKVLSPEGYSILPYANLTKISATYRGQTYFCGVNPTPTRYYMPEFYGLKVQNDYLLFGELDGTDEYKDEQLIIHWGADSIKSDTITFSRWIIGDGRVHSTFCLNGLPVEGQMEVQKALPRANNEKEVKPIELTEQQKACINPINHFGLNLLHTMVTDDRKSTIASPLGVAYVLAMIAGGTPAGSPTSVEIQQALSGILQDANSSDNSAMYYLMQREEIDDLFRTIIEQSPTTDPAVDLTVADAFFVRKEFPIYSGYVNFLANTYHADYGQLDFSSPEAIETINRWCNQKTNGLIPKIIEKIESDNIAFLMNAIYFRAPWKRPFYQESTRDEPFTKADGTNVILPMMHQENYFGYAETDDFQAIEMPFANGAYAMTFMLPKEGASLCQLIAQTNAYSLTELHKSLELLTTNVTLPRFDVDVTHDELIEQLKALGAKRIFTESAELSEISPTDLFVSMMLQKARIKINEEGCEAAAVTVAGVDGNGIDEPSTPKTFRADRPFAYFITERSTGLIFFAGTYCGD